MRKVVIILLRSYSYLLSPFLCNSCRIYYSCSFCAETVVHCFGFFRGLGLTFRRLSQCHPLHEGGFYPVPELKI